MRIVTIRPPWAQAIIHGGKDVENRVRNIAGAYRGPVAIHAAKTKADATETPQWPMLFDLWRSSTGYPLVFGAIIGVVDLVDVHWSGLSDCDDEHDERTTYCSPWADVDACHLVLANPRPLAEPIPYKGALGLRTLDAETTARVLAGVSV